jgi:NAD(P)-dependent dehydrogenase (short-subunit alcohol dehydrogenase family)
MNTQYQKVAVVTGASQGLGASIVDAYRKLGYAVVATSRTIAPSGDPGILTVQGDIADPATAERVIAAGVAQFGRIDTLVNNAGIFVAKPFTDYTQDDYAATIGVNLAGFFRITQLAIEQMLVHGGGHVVNVTTPPAASASTRSHRASSRPRCTRRRPMSSSRPCTRWPGWASRATSPRRSSTWRTPPSSPARSCMWTAA